MEKDLFEHNSMRKRGSQIHRKREKQRKMERKGVCVRERGGTHTHTHLKQEIRLSDLMKERRREQEREIDTHVHIQTHAH